MSEYRCFGRIGTTFVYCSWFESDYVLGSGEVWVTEYRDSQTPGPDRFGAWLVTAEGGYEWVKYPDPPFPIVYHEGKLKNADTMVEIAIEMLPGNIAARLAALEAAASPPSP